MTEIVAVRTIGGPHPGAWRLAWPWPPPAWLDAPEGGGRYVKISQHGITAQNRGVSYQWVTTPEEQRCKHEMLLSQCAECRAMPVVRPDWAHLHERSVTEAGRGPWITSIYNGRCAGCGYLWEPGERIRASDEEGGWVCETCGSAE